MYILTAEAQTNQLFSEELHLMQYLKDLEYLRDNTPSSWEEMQARYDNMVQWEELRKRYESLKQWDMNRKKKELKKEYRECIYVYSNLKI